MSKIVCSVCGSDDVQAKVWTKPNENFDRTCDLIDELIAEPADCWCCQCEENQKLIIIDENKTQPNETPEILRCEECGSSNVQIQAWVDPNNDNKFVSDQEDYKGSWCERCDSHVRVIPHSEFMANVVNSWWQQCNGEDKEVVSGLEEADFDSDDEYNCACDTIWNAKVDEDKIAIWHQINHREDYE